MVRITTAAAASANTVMMTAGPDEIIRVFAMSAQLNAGVAPTLKMRILIPGAGFSAVISGVLTVAAEPDTVPAIQPTIIVPTGVIEARHVGGDGATILEITLYAVRMPVGASPTV